MNLIVTDKKSHKLRPDLLVCLFLVIVTLVAYWQVRNYSLISFDDVSYILNNQHVREGLNFKGIAWAFSFPGYDYWHPLTWLSHMLDCHLYGLNFGMHHQVSLIFHILNSILLFLVFKKMTGTTWKSAFVAALFALHPMNVESVAWMAERKNVLSVFFGLLTIFAYIHYSKRPSVFKYLPILFVYTLGLMSKPMVATLPFALLLLDYWPLCRITLDHSVGNKQKPTEPNNAEFQKSRAVHLVLEKFPMFILSALSIFLSSLAVQRLGSVISTASVPMKLRIENALVSYISYITKMIWPHNLAVFYPFPQTLPLWQVSGAGLLLIWYNFSCVMDCKIQALSCCWMVLVYWNTFAGNWIGTGGLMAGYCRSVCLYAFHRTFYHCCLGCS